MTEFVGHQTSYFEFVKLTTNVAVNLQLRGLQPGDVVFINATNHSHYAVLFHGVLLAGGAVSPASPQYKSEELAVQILDSNAKYVVSSADVVSETIPAALRSNIDLDKVFIINGETLDHKDAAPFSVLLQETLQPLKAVSIDVKRDVCCLPYSSGTTGKPKGVVLTHYNLMSNMYQIAAVEKLSTADNLVGVLPFYHIYGLMITLNSSLSAGCKAAILSKFDLDIFLRTLKNFEVTRAHIAPPIAVALAKHPLVDKYLPFPHLKWLFSGASPLSADTENEVCNRLHVQCKQAYGMTELSPASHVSPDSLVKQGSVGPLLPNTECYIVDTAKGSFCQRNQVGEICIRGPQVMKEYLNRPDATTSTIDENGFLHTGDLGYADDDGYFFIVDRVKELIKYKGHQIAPAELEAVVLSHPDVADTAVCRSYDENHQEVPKAYVVLKPNANVSAKDIMDYVGERVAPFKKVRKVEFTSVIPKSAAGKILRRLLADQENRSSDAALQ